MNEEKSLVEIILYVEAKYEDSSDLIWLYKNQLHYSNSNNHIWFNDMTLETFTRLSMAIYVKKETSSLIARRF